MWGGPGVLLVARRGAWAWTDPGDKHGRLWSSSCVLPKLDVFILASSTWWPLFKSSLTRCHFISLAPTCSSAALRRAVTRDSERSEPGLWWPQVSAGTGGRTFILRQGHRTAGKRLRGSSIWGLKALDLQMALVLLSFRQPFGALVQLRPGAGAAFVSKDEWIQCSF